MHHVCFAKRISPCFRHGGMGALGYPLALFVRNRTAAGRVPVGVSSAFVSLFLMVGFFPTILLPGGAFGILPLAVVPLRLRVSPIVIREIEVRVPVEWGGPLPCSIALLDIFLRFGPYRSLCPAFLWYLFSRV